MLNYKINHQKGSSKAKNYNHFSQVKLPLLDKKGSDAFKKSLSKIKSGKLPLLHFHQTNLNPTIQSKKQGQSQINNPYEHSIDMNTNFAQQIEQKVNEIINKNQMFNMDYYTNDNQNFEVNIAKNKQYLKEQREKRASILKKKQNEQQFLKEDISKKKEENIKKKDEKIKSISKKKKRNESPGLTNSKSQSILTVDDQKDKSKPKGVLTNRLQRKMHQLKKRLGKRKNDSKINTEGDVEEAKSQNLFDNIHNYLANPHRLSFDQKNIGGSKLLSKKQSLQAKIRHLQQKISSLSKFQPLKVDQKPSTPILTEDKSEDEYGVYNWRRIEFLKNVDNKNKHLSMRESNFEKEVNHINNLQQRNQKSLQRYLQNQRILFDLKLMKTQTKDQLNRQFRSK